MAKTKTKKWDVVDHLKQKKTWPRISKPCSKTETPR